MRLRTASIEAPGITRRRRGSGFSYEDPDGPVREPETLERIRALVIPPAWTDVWICPDPAGHIQAAGTDAAGRRQYRYHDGWRARRDAEKFERMIAFAHVLPRLRERVAEDLATPGMPKRKALGCAVRLLDQGFFRVGSEAYARQNGSFGLATVRKEHVKVRDGLVVFDFRAKSGKRLVQEVADRDLAPVVGAMKRRRGGGPELLAYQDGRRWRDVRSADINEYLRGAAGGEFTAKDFRTWHATVLAAVFLGLAARSSTNTMSRRGVVSSAVREVAGLLGNTPAVARASYIDPRVLDRFEEGTTIGETLARLGIDDATDGVPPGRGGGGARPAGGAGRGCPRRLTVCRVARSGRPDTPTSRGFRCSRRTGPRTRPTPPSIRPTGTCCSPSWRTRWARCGARRSRSC